jgi:hypothetical protein
MWWRDGAVRQEQHEKQDEKEEVKTARTIVGRLL